MAICVLIVRYFALLAISELICVSLQSSFAERTQLQLLNLVVRKERPDLADLGEQLVEQQNGFKIKIKELEDNILYKLATAEGIPTTCLYGIRTQWRLFARSSCNS